MKTSAFLFLTVSLALNAILCFWLVRGAGNSPQPPAPSVTGTAVTPAKIVSPGVDEAIWPAMQTNELPTLVARLRAAGFPSDMLRAILLAQINESFMARAKAIDPEGEKRPYWKSAAPNLQIQAAYRQLSRDQQKVMRELLGEDAEPNDPMSMSQQQRQFGGVPPEKLAAARQILQEFADKRSVLFSGGSISSADYEKMQRDQEAAIAKLLTPTEYAEFELRSSSTANNLRSQLATFDPTEQEFRSLFQLQRAFDLQYPSISYSGSPTPEQQQLMRQRTDAQKVLMDQIKGALGPARAEDYTRSIDYEYQQTSRLVARLELPAETTNQVYTMQKEFQQRMSTIQQDRALPMEQRIQQLTALQQEATARVTPLLGGTRGLEAYKQYGGNWLQNMVPRPAAPSAAVPLPRG